VVELSRCQRKEHAVESIDSGFGMILEMDFHPHRWAKPMAGSKPFPAGGQSVGLGGVLLAFDEALDVGFFAWLHSDRRALSLGDRLRGAAFLWLGPPGGLDLLRGGASAGAYLLLKASLALTDALKK
jgi:hypothetical protein